MAVTVAIGLLLLCMKFGAYVLTHSDAILTDALESIVNVVAGLFALFSLYYASQPKDDNHPYGHGKMEFFSAGFEGGLICIAGVSMMGKAIYSFFHPPTIGALEWGALLTAVAGAVNYVLGRILIARGGRENSLLMIADGKHLISDTVSSIGLLLGLALIWLTGLKWLDQVIALLFGGVILRTGYHLITQSITSLLDEADYGRLGQLIAQLQANRRPQWIDIHNLRAIKFGSQLHVDCHLTLPWYQTLDWAHEQVSAVEDLIRRGDREDEEVEFFIHSDPCVMPSSCKVCQLDGCPHRQADLVQKIDWTLQNVLSNKKHTVPDK